MIQSLLVLLLLAPSPQVLPDTPRLSPVPISVLEPEDISVVHYIDGQNKPIPLEMHRSQLVTDRGRLFRGAREMLVVPGITSPVQFREGELPVFVVQVLLPMQLSTDYELFPLNVQKRENQRAVILTDSGWWSDTGSRGYHLRIRRHGQNSFKIFITNPLPPGEYAFKYGLSATKSKDIYCFTVLSKRTP